ncbi:MAG TPA: BON domain-containing protein [Gemmatimonadaceae bacterium]|nr:BON domain-containing protein [Gemmatimonadota bacterium]HNV75753.1 BON domain-containing protein [Gemmatimonadaceae bacterium]
MKAINKLGAVILLVLSTACGNTADGVKQDAENAADKTVKAADAAAEKTAEAAAATGEAVGGAMETGQVKSAIMADKRVDAGDINVDTDEGKKTVTLKGSVKTEAEKVIAGEIATAKATGYTIVNDLTIKK